MSKVKNWYAVYTRSRAEKKVATELERIGIERYLPLVKNLKQWSDRKKMVEEPLIRSYVFVRVTEKEFHYVLETYGVVHFIKFNGKAVPIPEWQIRNLVILLKSGVPFHQITDFEKGDFVIITRGPLKGLLGTVTSSNCKKRLIISLDAPAVNFMVDIHPANVETVNVPQKS